jgi:hypothetical protein
VNQRFQQVTVYFDTPFLLDALGYAGKEIAQPALELLGLIRDLGARLACFGHTVTELQGVLGGIANGLRNPRRRSVDAEPGGRALRARRPGPKRHRGEARWAGDQESCEARSEVPV